MVEGVVGLHYRIGIVAERHRWHCTAPRTIVGKGCIESLYMFGTHSLFATAVGGTAYGGGYGSYGSLQSIVVGSGSSYYTVAVKTCLGKYGCDVGRIGKAYNCAFLTKVFEYLLGRIVELKPYFAGGIYIVYIYTVATFEQQIFIFQHTGYPLRHRHYVVYTYLSVAIAVHVFQTFVGNFQPGGGARQHCPHLRVEFAEVCKVFARAYSYSESTPDIYKFPSILFVQQI